MTDEQFGWAWLSQVPSLVDGDAGACVELETGVSSLVIVERVRDGLPNAPGPVVCRLRRSADVAETSAGDGGSVSDTGGWMILWCADASDALRDFAAWCGHRIGSVGVTQARDGDLVAGETHSLWPLPQAAWRLARDLLWDWSLAAEAVPAPWFAWVSSTGAAWLAGLAEIDAELESRLSSLAPPTVA